MSIQIKRFQRKREAIIKWIQTPKLDMISLIHRKIYVSDYRAPKGSECDQKKLSYSYEPYLFSVLQTICFFIETQMDIILLSFLSPFSKLEPNLTIMYNKYRLQEYKIEQYSNENSVFIKTDG